MPAPPVGQTKVFTVIAGDSWNTIMYRTMENTTAVSSLFFVALIVLGEVGGAPANHRILCFRRAYALTNTLDTINSIQLQGSMSVSLSVFPVEYSVGLGVHPEPCIIACCGTKLLMNEN